MLTAAIWHRDMYCLGICVNIYWKTSTDWQKRGKKDCTWPKLLTLEPVLICLEQGLLQKCPTGDGIEIVATVPSLHLTNITCPWSQLQVVPLKLCDSLFSQKTCTWGPLPYRHLCAAIHSLRSIEGGGEVRDAGAALKFQSAKTFQTKVKVHQHLRKLTMLKHLLSWSVFT